METQVPETPFRVLSIDGGGMRGIYAAAYLARLCHFSASERKAENGVDLGAAFDLIAGTSTGGLLAMALAFGLAPDQLSELYRTEGRRIFPAKLSDAATLRGFPRQLFRRPAMLRSGERALRGALERVFGETTLGELYEQRGIALAIPAVEMTNHRGWIFKTPHLPREQTWRRDDDYRLVDVGLATTAAPLFRSLAAVDNPNGEGHQVFADGGLFANNPVLVGLVEALRVAPKGQPIEVFSLGTCERPSGRILAEDDVHLGLRDWQFGGRAASLALDAQSRASWDVAHLLRGYLEPAVEMVRFPSGTLPSDAHHLLDLDDASEEAARALAMQAEADIQTVLSMCKDGHSRDGQLIYDLLMSAPENQS